MQAKSLGLVFARERDNKLKVQLLCQGPSVFRCFLRKGLRPNSKIIFYWSQPTFQ